MPSLLPTYWRVEPRLLARILPCLLVTVYLTLVVFAALCASGTMMPNPHQHAHHHTHQMGLCAWACHVAQTSSQSAHVEAVAASLLFVACIIFPIQVSTPQTVPIFQPSRGPPRIL